MSDFKTQGAGAATVDSRRKQLKSRFFLSGRRHLRAWQSPYKDHGGSPARRRAEFWCKSYMPAAETARTTTHLTGRGRLDSEMDDDEADRLDMAADLQLNSRLGCQAVINKPGKVVVEIPAWNRNYVSETH